MESLHLWTRQHAECCEGLTSWVPFHNSKSGERCCRLIQEEAKAQKGEIPYPGPHSEEVMGPGFHLRQSYLNSRLPPLLPTSSQNQDQTHHQ